MKIKRKETGWTEAILVTSENVKFVVAAVNAAWGAEDLKSCVTVGDVVALSAGGEIVEVISAEEFAAGWVVKTLGRPRGSKNKATAAEEVGPRQLEIHAREP